MNPSRCAFARQLAEGARKLAAQARGIDLHAVEDVRESEARLVLASHITALAGETIALLTQAIDAFDDDGGEQSSDSQQLSDVAAIARMTLREKEQLLLRIELEGDPWEIVDRCDGALRAIAKGLLAIEHALADACGFAPSIEIVDECARGIRVRTVYAKFRMAVMDLEQRHESIAARIRGAATALAILTGRDEYPLIRISDRRQLRKLQQRARAWLAGDPQKETDGEHLWQELLAVTSLLMQINGRSELVEHDRRVLQELCAELRFRNASLESLRPRLASLRGVDLALDRLFDGRVVEAQAWQEAVCRLAAAHARVSVDTERAAMEPELAATARG